MDFPMPASIVINLLKGKETSEAIQASGIEKWHVDLEDQNKHSKIPSSSVTLACLIDKSVR